MGCAESRHGGGWTATGGSLTSYFLAYDDANADRSKQTRSGVDPAVNDAIGRLLDRIDVAVDGEPTQPARQFTPPESAAIDRAWQAAGGADGVVPSLRRLEQGLPSLLSGAPSSGWSLEQVAEEERAAGRKAHPAGASAEMGSIGPPSPAKASLGAAAGGDESVELDHFERLLARLLAPALGPPEYASAQALSVSAMLVLPSEGVVVAACEALSLLDTIEQKLESLGVLPSERHAGAICCFTDRLLLPAGTAAADGGAAASPLRSLWELPMATGATSLGWAAPTRRLLVGGATGSIRLYSIGAKWATASYMGSIDAHTARVTCLTCLPPPPPPPDAPPANAPPPHRRRRRPTRRRGGGVGESGDGAAADFDDPLRALAGGGGGPPGAPPPRRRRNRCRRRRRRRRPRGGRRRWRCRALQSSARTRFVCTMWTRWRRWRRESC